jgi:hypothetical protein
MQGQNFNSYSHLPLGHVRKIEQAQNPIRLKDENFEEPDPASMSFARKISN